MPVDATAQRGRGCTQKTKVGHARMRCSKAEPATREELHREADLEPARNLLALIVADLYMQLLHEVIDIKLVVVMTR